MTKFIPAFSLLLLMIGSLYAGELTRIDLKDGSSLTGEVVSLSNGIYTIKSDSLGTIRIEQEKIRAIETAPPSTAGAAANSAAAADPLSLQQKMMHDKEIMDKIQSLQNDPDFQELLKDPKILRAVNAGDVATLSADPRFTKLLTNPTVQEIQNKVK